mmetsp:Transcript_32355/g.53551  ORF Transcript_32355/g.53551 Transcript_32355/m.53551 type:complete len:347 (+) Transcript_32355:131-1171(+)|eukprot:CAMPEP_0119329550 /NCGR_PEP_ID=MMETSP1333-20130426/76137_1 /TAXON_ID=418940 /ORGANISM="Scyphosphaera apsteinii, Strain RCC1455" /LENGTH=346 /DNA_ID=CAMNT_0007338699 /DNA_START=123 /DNA_END=1163 /DNA_ORIENTATION=+
MSFDRTSEFQKIVAQRQAQQQAKQKSLATRPTTSATAERSEFTAAASQIGHDIHATAEKLSKLTQLAQSNSLLLFADPTEEIDHLTYIIKGDIQSLQAKVAALKQKMQGQRPDTHQSAKHSNSIVEQLGMRLGDAIRDFQGVLQTRSENVKLRHDRRERILDRRDEMSASSPSPGPSAGPSAGNLAAQPNSIFECGSPLGASTAGSIFECGTPFGTPQGSMASKPCDGGDAMHGDAEIVIDIPQQTQTQLVSATSTYLESRAHAVDSVQSTLVELGAIFEQLAMIISEQGAMVKRVDEETEITLTNTNAAYVELQKYMTNMRSNRGLILKVFAILCFFIVIFGTLY